MGRIDPADAALWLSLPFAELSVALPLAAALLALALRRHAPLLALPLAAALLVLALLLVWRVAVGGAYGVPLGGWAPPLGIVLNVDGLAAAFVLTTALVAGTVSAFALRTFKSAPEGETRSAFAFWPMLFSLWAALNAVFLGGDLFNLYVALELLTLTAIALVAIEGRAATIAAALRYMLFALIGSLAYLTGAVLLYAGYGTLDMRLLRAGVAPDTLTWTAAALMTAGLMAKTALFPLHAWLPPAHGGAPAPVSALLSALVTKASFFIVVRLWFDVLPGVATFPTTQALGALGAGGILFGSFLAMRQKRLKAIVAYSTVAQLGYLFLVFPLAGGAEDLPWRAGAWSGGIFHALSHAFAKAAMFLAAGIMVQAIGHDRLDGLAGIGRALPMTSFAFGLSALSLMGLPPSGGFIAKYLLLVAALASGQVWWALVILAGGLLAAVYLFRPLNRILARPAEGITLAHVPRWQEILPLFLASASVLLGLAPAMLFRLIQIGRDVAAEEGIE